MRKNSKRRHKKKQKRIQFVIMDDQTEESFSETRTEQSESESQSEQILGVISNENIPEVVAGKIPEVVAGKIPEVVAGKIPEVVAGKIPEVVAGKIPLVNKNSELLAEMAGLNNMSILNDVADYYEDYDDENGENEEDYENEVEEQVEVDIEVEEEVEEEESSEDMSVYRPEIGTALEKSILQMSKDEYVESLTDYYDKWVGKMQQYTTPMKQFGVAMNFFSASVGGGEQGGGDMALTQMGYAASVDLLTQYLLYLMQNQDGVTFIL